MRLADTLKGLMLLKTEPLFLPSKSFHFFSAASNNETKRKQEKK